MEIAEVLFAKSGFFVDFDGGAGEGRRGCGGILGGGIAGGGVRGRGGGWEGGGKGAEDALCSFAGAAVGGGEEVEGVAWVEEGAEFAAGFFGLEYDVQIRGWERESVGRAHLLPSFGGEFHAVVWDGLVDFTIF